MYSINAYEKIKEENQISNLLTAEEKREIIASRKEQLADKLIESETIKDLKEIEALVHKLRILLETLTDAN